MFEKYMTLKYSDIPDWIKKLKRLGDYPRLKELTSKNFFGTIFTWHLDNSQQFIKPVSNEDSPFGTIIIKCKVLGEGDLSPREEKIETRTLIEDIESGFLQELIDEAILAKLALLDF
jgi:hypothetical protein